MGELLVRNSTETDLPEIQAIYAFEVLNGIATFEETAPSVVEMARRRQTVLDAGLPHLVAERDGVVIGFSYAGPYHTRPAYRNTVEDSVYIAPQARGLGAGRTLLSQLIADCTNADCRQMIAVIGNSGNQGSIALHRRLGFRDVGVLKSVGFKLGRWVDTVIMQRPLGAANQTDPGTPTT